jgi:Na+-translocating ferredoxin:NAD+ oxidoreductase subunit D
MVRERMTSGPSLSSPHLRVEPSVTQVMRRVLLALVPGVAVFTLYFGPGVLLNVLIAVVAALAFEALALRWRVRAVQPALADLSAVVTGVLLALSLPPGCPWWIPVTGVGFALLLAKHLFGGLGYNPFNPAMVGFVVLLICFPVEMTAWPAVQPPWQSGVDALTSATPLDHVRTELALARTLGEVHSDPVFGVLAGRGWEWINLAYLLGGLWLLWRGVIRWQIPAGVLLGIALPALLFWAGDSDRYASPLFHLLSGATMLGAFFIATDPVTASTTPRGRFLYGLGIGILIHLIRTWGAYPDAVAFAVLLLNICAPTIDRYTPPRVYGQKRRDAP